MLKVLVVDDEKLVRQMIQRCIDWNSLGFEIIGEAAGGEEGLSIAEEKRPQVVFTDIRMPVMDGLAFSRRLLERHPGTKIIILSGHDEFEYASEGIKLGVFDYLLKPIDQEEMTAALEKVKAAIFEERSHEEEFVRLKEELDRNADYILEKQLAALVRSQTPRELEKGLRYFGVHFQNIVYQIALVEVIFDGTEYENSDEEKKILLKMHCQQLVREFFEHNDHIYSFSSGNQSISILNNENDTDFYEVCDILKDFLIEKTGCHISIGVGEAYEEMEQLRVSYREAKDALKYRFVAGMNQTICFRDIYPYYDTEINNNEELVHEFGFYIRSSLMQETMELLERTVNNMRVSKLTKEQAVLFTLRFVMELLTIMMELKIDAGQMPKSRSKMIEDVFGLNSLEEIHAYLRELILTSSKVIMKELGDKEKNMVHNIKEYLVEHYQDEELSLSMVAKLFYTNSSYLSRVFKEKVGKTFSGYLFDLRLEQAVQLFRQSDLKAYEVAERIGIKDPHYFSVCFKKYTGMSVSDYKKSLQM